MKIYFLTFAKLYDHIKRKHRFELYKICNAQGVCKLNKPKIQPQR